MIKRKKLINKKNIIKFLLILLIFIAKSSVLAYISVDYEVTSAKVDKSGNLTIKGWGRLFAGNCSKDGCYESKVKPKLIEGFDDFKKLPSGSYSNLE